MPSSHEIHAVALAEESHVQTRNKKDAETPHLTFCYIDSSLYKYAVVDGS